MDHMMPLMDGIEATRLIRETDTEYARNIPIIAFTANAVAGSKQMFLSKGFQDFLSKPINISGLDEIIHRWIRNKEKEQLLPDDEVILSAQNGTEGRLKNIQLAGLDIRKGIDRFNGDEESYLDVLRSYAVSTASLLDSIEDTSKYKEKLIEYAIITHGIKGSSRGIFAGLIGNSAEALEKAARAGDFSYVKKNNAKFIESARDLVDDIKDMLKALDAENLKPKKEEPDKGLLIKLANACAEFDISRADELFSELDAFEYNTGSELMIWLKDNVENGFFEDIKDKIEELIDKGDI
jgi:CheY-like chemotaxis protein